MELVMSDREELLQLMNEFYARGQQVQVLRAGRESAAVRRIVAGQVGGTETVANRGRRYVWAREQSNLRAS